MSDISVDRLTAMQIGRIDAVLYASESTIAKVKEHNDRSTILMAKETAYDHIKGIMEDPGWCPWQE